MESNQAREEFPIMYERVAGWIFYLSSVCLCVGLVVFTLLLRNVMTYFEVLALPYAIAVNSILANLCLVKLNGAKKEKIAFSCLVIGIIEVVLSIVFAIIDVVR